MATARKTRLKPLAQPPEVQADPEVTETTAAAEESAGMVADVPPLPPDDSQPLRDRLDEWLKLLFPDELHTPEFGSTDTGYYAAACTHWPSDEWRNRYMRAELRYYGGSTYYVDAKVAVAANMLARMGLHVRRFVGKADYPYAEIATVPLNPAEKNAVQDAQTTA